MKLFLFFVVAPIIEIFVIVRTGQWIGFLNTLGLIILGGFVGSAVLRRGGTKAWARFVQQVQAGQEPSKEIANGVCILLAGALFIAPGFISDAAALLLLFPPTRALFRSWLMRRKGLGSLGNGRVIRATYAGPQDFLRGRRSTTITDVTEVTDVTDVTDVSSTETRGELDP